MNRIVIASVIALACFGISVVQAQPPPPTKTFDWEKYDERQTACKLYDQALLECTQNNACNQTIIDQLRRRCSAMR